MLGTSDQIALHGRLVPQGAHRCRKETINEPARVRSWIGYVCSQGKVLKLASVDDPLLSSNLPSSNFPLRGKGSASLNQKHSTFTALVEVLSGGLALET
jgi:hypothetical protein